MYRNTVKNASFLLQGSHFADQFSSNDFSLFHDDVSKNAQVKELPLNEFLFKTVNDVTNTIAILTKKKKTHN